jgi:acyl transferase domain-containing protein
MPDEEKLQKYLRKVTAELQQARRRLAAAESQNHEPIAIIGIGCRFPGGVRSPEDLWDLVDSGADAVGGLPTGRGWHLGNQLAGVNGGFLYDVDQFDAHFFGLNDTEAVAMDPQQRLLLETSWEAFERAGIDPVAARGSRTAVYAGLQFGGYPLLLREAPPEHVLDYLGLGNSVGAGSGRLSYLLGLVGGAVTVDTQCTSSIVAIHLASKALRNGECSLALAGGACVMSVPTVLMDFHRRNTLAPDGRSKSFAAAANGVSLAEGAGMLLLERLSDARRNGHPVMAIIRGSAINQDGATNGIASPSGRAQERVIRQALADGRITADSVDALEGHGVGATLGDGVEATSLIATYGQERPGGRPLLLGSVKSNIGHTQTVGAVAGITKLVMAMRNERLPRTLHVDKPTTHADWSAGTLRLLTEPEPWQRGERVRRAGLTCLTISGTNGHLVLEEPPAEEPPARPAGPERAVPWVISARSPAALREQAARLRDGVAPAAEPVDVGHSLHTTRSTFKHRAVVVGTGRDELVAGLEALAGARASDGLVRGAARSQGQTALVFGGAGSGLRAGEPGADAAAARGTLGLYEAFPAFATALDEVVEQLADAFGPEIRTAVREPGQAVAEPTAAGQAAAFALNIALYRLLEAFGVRPNAVLGHGVGEVAAAHTVGALPAADAVALVRALGRVTEKVNAGPGASVWVRASEEEVRAALDGTDAAGVAVAAVDEPGATVVSGDADAIGRVAAHWRALGRETGAPHPARLLPPGASGDGAALAEFRAIVGKVAFREPEVPLVSTVTGLPVGLAELGSAEHWLDHVRRPTRFLDGVRRLRTDGVTRLVELGVSRDLTRLAGRCVAGSGEAGQPVLLTSVLGGERPEEQALLAALGELHTDGVEIDWSPAFAGRGARRVDLPTYPYQKTRCWLVPPEPRAGSAAAPAGPPAEPPHPLLGTDLDLVDAPGRSFTQRLTPGQVAAVFGRRLHGTPTLPTGARLEWLLAAARHGAPDAAWVLSDVRLPGVVSAADGAAVAAQTSREETGDGLRVRAFIKEEGPEGGAWVERGAATAAAAGAQPSADRVDPRSLHAGLAELDVAEAYPRLWRQGSDYAEPLRVLDRVWLGRDEAVGRVDMAELPAGPAGPWARWATVFEAAVQLVSLLGSGSSAPVSLDRLEVFGPPSGVVWLRAHRECSGAVDVAMLSEEGQRVAAVDGLRMEPVEGAALARLAGAELRRHELVWRALAEGERPGTIGGGDGSWLVFSDDPGQAAAWSGDLALLGVPAIALTAEDGEDGGDGGDGGERPGGAERVPVGTGDPDMVRKTFAGLRERGVTVAGLLVHGTGGDGEQDDDPVNDQVNAACQRGARMLELLRGFLREYAEQAPRVVLCSAGAVGGPGGGTPRLARTPLTALATSVVWEHPGLACVQVDLDPDAGPPAVETLLGQVTRLSGAGRLALRGGRWFEARLQSAPEATPEETGETGEPGVVRPDATYLVAGGSTRHAVAALDWLAARGARSVVLAGVEAAPSGAGIERLEHVAFEPASVADVDRLSGLLGDGRPPLRGVVLLPETVEAGGLESLDGPRFATALADALRGPWEMTRRFAGDVDFFLLSTSVTSLPGRAGEVVRSAADAFLTGLARRSRAAGLPVVAVGWGPWLEAVDETPEPVAALAEAGVYAAPGGEGLELLARMLDRGAAGEGEVSEVSLARVDWERFLSAGGRRVPYTLLDGGAADEEETIPGFGQKRMNSARKKKQEVTG